MLMDIHTEIGGIEKVEKMMNDAADQQAYQEVCAILYKTFPQKACGQTSEANQMSRNRKSANCSAARSRPRTRLPWRTSLQHSRPRWLARGRPSPACQLQSCQKRRRKSRMLHQFRRKGRPSLRESSSFGSFVHAKPYIHPTRCYLGYPPYREIETQHTFKFKDKAPESHI